MKKIILGFAMIVGLSQAVFSQLQVGLILQGSSTPVLCEPIPVQIYWENKGAKPIKVGPPIDPKFSKALSLWVDGRKAMSFPPPDAPVGLISPLAPSDLKPRERIEKPYDLRMLKLRPGAHQVKLVADFVGFPEGYFQGCVESATIEITMQTPQGVDQQAYEFAAGMADRGETNTPYMSRDEAICVALETSDVLAKYPTSIYAGWSLKNLHFETPGVFVKNEAATKSILAAINRDKAEIAKHWRLDVPLPEDQRVRDRKVVMRQLVEHSEAFASINPDFLFSGWILARAGFNALGLGDFGTACVDLKRSLELGWNLPGASKNAEPSYKEGVTHALELLKQNGYCKKN